MSTEAPAIEAAQYVKDYIESKIAFRGEPDSLFLSWSTKKPVGKTTLGRWLKEVLQLAGIDTAIFKAHSFRWAGLSKAHDKGTSIDQILATGNWSGS